jgi:peptide-N4-(N-acetyl-beta-glucosaminyl)asparagine amidase
MGPTPLLFHVVQSSSPTFLLKLFISLYSTGSKVFETTDFQGCSQLEFTAQLGDGTGDCAWQHAQLFRQNISDTDYPLDIVIRFKRQP